MKLRLKLKNGKSYIYSEEQSKHIAKSLNYIKLLQVFNKENPDQDIKLKFLNQTYTVGEIKSLEFIF